jgi:hypothetical protein
MSESLSASACVRACESDSDECKRSDGTQYKKFDERETETETDRDRDTKTEMQRQRDRETERQRDTERHRETRRLTATFAKLSFLVRYAAIASTSNASDIWSEHLVSCWPAGCPNPSWPTQGKPVALSHLLQSGNGADLFFNHEGFRHQSLQWACRVKNVTLVVWRKVRRVKGAWRRSRP